MLIAPPCVNVIVEEVLEAASGISKPRLSNLVLGLHTGEFARCSKTKGGMAEDVVTEAATAMANDIWVNRNAFLTKLRVAKTRKTRSQVPEAEDESEQGNTTINPPHETHKFLNQTFL